MPRLTGAGYTVFVVNDPGLPAFRSPDAVQDCQRAVRFSRHYAARFGIDPARIGGVGGSSGARLIPLPGTLDGKGDPSDPDAVNRENARPQAVAARALPAGFSPGNGVLIDFLGISKSQRMKGEGHKAADKASPIAHVAPASAPFLLMQGDADQAFPCRQSANMEAALKRAGVPVKLPRIPGGTHRPRFKGAGAPPDFMGDTLRWLDL